MRHHGWVTRNPMKLDFRSTRRLLTIGVQTLSRIQVSWRLNFRMHCLTIDTAYGSGLDPWKGATLKLLLIAHKMRRLSCLLNILLMTCVSQHGPDWTLSANQVAAGVVLGDFIRVGGSLRSFLSMVVQLPSKWAQSVLWAAGAGYILLERTLTLGRLLHCLKHGQCVLAVVE